MPPQGQAGAVLDGRDIGTVICPDADIKIFVIADVETRAQRRFDELSAKGESLPDYATILSQLKERDHRDQNRSTAPLKQADDAYLLDTTNSDIEAVFESALTLVKKKLGL